MYYEFVSVNNLDGHKISCEYLKIKKFVYDTLKNEKLIELKNITEQITNGIRIRKEYYSQDGFRVIGPGDIKNGVVVFDALKCVKKDIVNEKDTVNKGDILITAVGRSGQIIYVEDDLDEVVITSDIIKITMKNKEGVKLLVNFLRSNIGQNIINMQKGSRGNRLLVKNIENMMIPKEFYKYIDSCNDTVDLNLGAYESLKKAEVLFSKYLYYKGESESKKFFFINKELNVDRLDFNYYSKLYSNLYKLVNTDTEDIKWQRLRDLIEIKKAVKPKLNDYDEVRYFTLSDVDANLSIVKETHKEVYCNLSNRMRHIVEEGEIITAKAGSATGTKSHATVLITKELDGMLTSDVLFNLIPKKIDKYYLLFLLKQNIIISQISMIAKGTVYKLVQREEFENIRIPRFKKEVEDLIISYMKSYTLSIKSDSEKEVD